MCLHLIIFFFFLSFFLMSFSTPINSGVLVCTDVMARGVDIPDVNWVIQYDPPSSARYELSKHQYCNNIKRKMLTHYEKLRKAYSISIVLVKDRVRIAHGIWEKNVHIRKTAGIRSFRLKVNQRMKKIKKKGRGKKQSKKDKKKETRDIIRNKNFAWITKSKWVYTIFFLERRTLF